MGGRSDVKFMVDFTVIGQAYFGKHEKHAQHLGTVDQPLVE